LERADDRREVGRARREGLVVHGLEAELLDILAGAFAGIARELGVLGVSATVVGFGFLSRGDLEEAGGEGWPRVLPGRQHREYLSYLNSAFTSSANRLMKVLPFCITTGIAAQPCWWRNR